MGPAPALRSLGQSEYAAWTAAADAADSDLDAIVAALTHHQQPAAPATSSDTNQGATAAASAAVPDFASDAADADAVPARRRADDGQSDPGQVSAAATTTRKHTHSH